MGGSFRGIALVQGIGQDDGCCWVLLNVCREGYSTSILILMLGINSSDFESEILGIDV